MLASDVTIGRVGSATTVSRVLVSNSNSLPVKSSGSVDGLAAVEELAGIVEVSSRFAGGATTAGGFAGGATTVPATSGKVDIGAATSCRCTAATVSVSVGADGAGAPFVVFRFS